MAETMKDFERELEESYKLMGDGEQDTDTLIAWGKIKELYDTKETLTLEVAGIVNKGVIVLVEGIRGFVPASRLSLQRVEDLNSWLGKTVQVRIITADQEAGKLVLSAREILQEMEAAKKKEKISKIEAGAVYTGVVEKIQDYGAFVKIADGVSGLVHISQISMERIKHPSMALTEGQEVQVKVLEVKDGKIRLSMKILLEEAKAKEESAVELPEVEEIGTSMGDLLKNLKF